jgi:ankyrin repeat protein
LSCPNRREFIRNSSNLLYEAPFRREFPAIFRLLSETGHLSSQKHCYVMCIGDLPHSLCLWNPQSLMLISLTEVPEFVAFLPMPRFRPMALTLLVVAMSIALPVSCRKRSQLELGLALVNAVREGSAGEVRDLLASGASTSARDEDGEILWRVALEHYNRKVWEVLTENGLDLSEPDSSGSLPIHVAAANGMAEACERIMKITAGKKQLNPAKDTPLIAAARYGSAETLKVLREYFQSADEQNKVGDTALIEAARSGNIKAVDEILRYRPSIAMANYFGQTALSQAQYYTFMDIVERLQAFGAENPEASKALLAAVKVKDLAAAQAAVNRGANVNVMDDRGYSPLSYAVELADAPMIEYLRSRGAMNAFASRKLMLAIRADNLEVFNTALNEFADPNYTDKDLQTPLIVAAAYGNYDMLKILLERGAQVNARDKDGYSAVFYAAQENRVRILDELIKRQADLVRKNNFGYTPLILAAAKGHVEAVRRLVEAGVDVNATADNGGTAAYWAAIKDYDEVVKILVAAGAVDPKNNKELVRAAQSNDVARAEKALQANINIDLKNEDGYTALMYAVNAGSLDVARLILSRKARINLQDRDGYSALMIAAYRGNAEMLDLLLQYKPDVNLRHRSGRTALIMAAWKGTAQMVQRLIAAGARVNDQDLDGWTALMFSAYVGDLEKVKILTAARANAALKNKKGQTAYDLAQSRNAAEVAEFLAAKKG